MTGNLPDYSDIGDFPDGRSAARYAEDLQNLISAIRGGNPPSSEELESAPTIHDWYIEQLNEPVLEAEFGIPIFRIWGYFKNHPFLDPNELSHSSPVLQFDEAKTWARCASRVYVLKRPSAVFEP